MKKLSTQAQFNQFVHQYNNIVEAIEDIDNELALNRRGYMLPGFCLQKMLHKDAVFTQQRERAVKSAQQLKAIIEYNIPYFDIPANENEPVAMTVGALKNFVKGYVSEITGIPAEFMVAERFDAAFERIFEQFSGDNESDTELAMFVIEL